jgi:GAF domain-containing protein
MDMTDDLLTSPGDLGTQRDPATAELFSALARTVYASDDYSEVYDAIVRAAPRVIDGCDRASLMLLDHGRFRTAAASDPVAETVDRLEREVGEGPCLDAILDEAVYRDTDLTQASAWPRLRERVLRETPVRGITGVRLVTEERKSGALNVFSDRPDGLTPDSVDQALVLAAFVEVAMLAAGQRATASTLRAGLESNREIGKAIGLMMAFHKVDDREAFEILRRASQEMNVKLVEVAREVLAHHNRV